MIIVVVAIETIGPFCFHMSSKEMYVMSHVWLAGMCGRNFNIGRYTQTFQSNMFIPAMLVGIVDFCHFVPIHWP